MIVLDLRWLLFTMLVLLVTAVVCTAAITQWLNKRKQLLRTIDQLRPQLDAAPAAVVAFARSNHIYYANELAHQLLALPAGHRALPHNIWSDLQAQGALADSFDYTPAMLSPTWRKLRFHPSESDGTLLLGWWVIALPDMLITIVTDVTAQQAATQEMRLLLSGLSHELRTPLATIATHVEVLRIPTLPPEVQGQSLHFIADEIQRLVRLVGNVMELGRLENGVEQDIQPVNLAQIAEEAVIQLSDVAQAAGAGIAFAAQATNLVVLGQPDRLKQVFLNLLDNAIKYGGRGNQITVSLLPARGGVHCTVQDTGPGIAPEHLPLLARQYYRAAPASIPGNGLGLAIVSAILRQHGSRLQITSKTAAPAHGQAVAEEQPTGTCVSFMIPSAGRGNSL